MVHWKLNGIYKADAEKVYSEITAIGEKVTPEEIVEKARDENTELHSCFEWDDSIAAEKWRCTQARNIIKMLVVEAHEIGNTESKEPIRVIVNTDSANRIYEQTKVVITNVDKYAQLLETAKRELLAFKKKYSTLNELKPIFEMIDEII